MSDDARVDPSSSEEAQEQQLERVLVAVKVRSGHKRRRRAGARIAVAVTGMAIVAAIVLARPPAADQVVFVAGTDPFTAPTTVPANRSTLSSLATSTSTSVYVGSVMPIDDQVVVTWLPQGYQLRADRREGLHPRGVYARRLAYTLGGAYLDAPNAALLRIDAWTGDTSLRANTQGSTTVASGETLYVSAATEPSRPTTVRFIKAQTVVEITSVELGVPDLIEIAKGVRLNIIDCARQEAGSETGCEAGLIVRPDDGGYASRSRTETTVKN